MIRIKLSSAVTWRIERLAKNYSSVSKPLNFVMNITNIEIERVIIHEVVRASQMIERPPVLNENLISLDENGKALVSNRLTTILGSGSHCIEVMVNDATQGSPFDLATLMIDASDEDFTATSQLIAQNLSTVQIAGQIKSGSAIFVQGTCAAENLQSRFMAIIKADADKGLYKEIVEENITLTYVNDMLLGESQRLVKIAFFVEDEQPRFNEELSSRALRTPEEFSITVFDHLMQLSSDKSAAEYFYSTFLKCRFADSDSIQTKQLYTVTSEFIDEINVPQEERVKLRGDLISYFRSNRAILEPRTLAKDILPELHHDNFIRKCRAAGITQAITKDLEIVKGKFKRQSVKFTSNVTLYAPPDVFRDSVKIIGTDEDGWTELKIRGSVEAKS